VWTLPALILAACAEAGIVAREPASSSALPPPASTWAQVFFTSPEDFTGDFRGGVDADIVASLDAARFSIDVASLEFNLNSISRALMRAAERGVKVRVVVDSTYVQARALSDLELAGIPVLGDRREGLMHDKFVVVDGALVWTGSMNLTTSDTYRNNNNLIRIDSAELAQAYEREFEEMFVDDMFGPDSPRGWPAPRLEFGESWVEVYFAPDDAPADRLLQALESAQHSIRFMAFSLTSEDVAEVLIRQNRQGLEVAGVMEESQVRSNANGKYDLLRAAGVDVRLDGNPRNMHHKVIVIDEQLVITGSYNFSYNAENVNDENLLVIHDSELARLYLEEFDRVWRQAQ
jgi:phosphatidylserine/phosphatidylglycerophosphate/cardiolipin synthase-like enzyme